MTNIQTNYQALLPMQDEEAECESIRPDNDDVIFHITPESGKSRWSHVEDLDAFFRKIYDYHQRHGLSCIISTEIYDFIQFPFLVLTLIYFANCVSFDNANPTHPSNSTFVEKRHIYDMFAPPSVCLRRMSLWYWILIIFVAVICMHRAARLICNVNGLLNMRDFYTSGLKISSAELPNTTWHEVQCKLREFQHDHQMCVRAQELTELDIYHRILRHNNYLVAMVNKSILPVKFNLPFFGEVIYFSSGFEYNLKLLLFWSPFSPFKSTWQLKDDYKKYHKRKELAEWLSKVILTIGIINIVCLPIITMLRILYLIFTIGPELKGDVGALCLRRWSKYAKLYLRHFNELEHEVKNRLNRAYKPSVQYMNCFWSFFTEIHARKASSVFGFLLFIFVLWTLIDERMLQVEHMIFFTYCFHKIYEGTVKILPDDNMVILPETMMTQILSEIHYIPDHWKKKAHTSLVRDEFSQLFPLTINVILEELLCPIVTPLIFIFCLRHRSLDIVDFFRSFTVDVVGVGDVCSFALMDVSKHGQHKWFDYDHALADQYQQAEDGKTELSLMHFTVTNPYWRPPPSSDSFIAHFRSRAQMDLERLPAQQQDNVMYRSLCSMQSFGSTPAALANSLLYNRSGRSNTGQSLLLLSTDAVDNSTVHARGMGMFSAEGPVFFNEVDTLSSIHANSSGMYRPNESVNPLDYRVANMSFNAVYIHGVHQEQVLLETSNSRVAQNSVHELPQPAPADENTFNDEMHPLLVQRASQ